MNFNRLRQMFIKKGDNMQLFKEMKNNKYIENMTIGAKTQLSLLETLNALQQEYEKYYNIKEKETEQLIKENNILKSEIQKIKSNK